MRYIQTGRPSALRSSPKQIWEIGNIVKVGFLKVKILAILDNANGPWKTIRTKGSYFLVEGVTNGKQYNFSPHLGLEAI